MAAAIRGSAALPNLDFELLASGAVKEYVSGV